MQEKKRRIIIDGEAQDIVKSCSTFSEEATDYLLDYYNSREWKERLPDLDSASKTELCNFLAKQLNIPHMEIVDLVDFVNSSPFELDKLGLQDLIDPVLYHFINEPVQMPPEKGRYDLSTLKKLLEQYGIARLVSPLTRKKWNYSQDDLKDRRIIDTQWQLKQINSLWKKYRPFLPWTIDALVLFPWSEGVVQVQSLPMVGLKPAFENSILENFKISRLDARWKGVKSKNFGKYKLVWPEFHPSLPVNPMATSLLCTLVTGPLLFLGMRNLVKEDLSSILAEIKLFLAKHCLKSHEEAIKDILNLLPNPQAIPAIPSLM